MCHKGVDTRIDAWDLITLFLLFEKQMAKQSNWWIYIQSLPEKFNNPLTWPEEFYDLLPKQTRKAAEEALSDAHKRYKNIEEINRRSKLLVKLNWDDFVWAQERGFMI